MLASPESDFDAWAQSIHDSIKVKSTCFTFLSQFMPLFQYYIQNHNLPKPFRHKIEEFTSQIVPQTINGILSVRNSDDIYISNVIKFLKSVDVLFFSDILQGNYEFVNVFLNIFDSSQPIYSSGMTPFYKSNAFPDVCRAFLEENPLQKLMMKIDQKIDLYLLYILFRFFVDLKDFVNQDEINYYFIQACEPFKNCLSSLETEKLSCINPKSINWSIKFVLKFTSNKSNFETLWLKISQFLVFALQSKNKECQIMAARAFNNMAKYSAAVYRELVQKIFTKIDFLAMMISQEYDDDTSRYFSSIISRFLSIYTPNKARMLQIYDIIVEEKKKLQLQQLFIYFFKNMPSSLCADLLSTIFDTRPTTDKHVEILVLLVSELIILNLMVGNKIIDHFFVLIEKKDTANVSLLFFQKVLQSPLPYEILTVIVNYAIRKLKESVISDTSLSLVKILIITPNRIGGKLSFLLTDSIIDTIVTHENQAEILFNLIVKTLCIDNKSVLSSNQLKKLLPLIRKNEWWENLNSIFAKRNSLFFTSNGLKEFEKELNYINFETASPQFTDFLLSFIFCMCTYNKVLVLPKCNFISIQGFPNFNFIVKVVTETANEQCFELVQQFLVFVWLNISKITPKEVTLHFLKYFGDFLKNDQKPEHVKIVSQNNQNGDDNINEIKSLHDTDIKCRIFSLLKKLVNIFETPYSIEDFGVMRHRCTTYIIVKVEIVYLTSFEMRVNENQTVATIPIKAAFLQKLSQDSLLLVTKCDPNLTIKQSNIRSFKLEMIKEKKVNYSLSDMPTQILLDFGITEILLTILEFENSKHSWSLLQKLPTQKELIEKLLNPNEAETIFKNIKNVSHYYYRYEIESFLEIINTIDNKTDYNKCSIIILKELLNGNLSKKAIEPALKIIEYINPDLNEVELKETLNFILKNKYNSINLLAILTQKYPDLISKVLFAKDSVLYQKFYQMQTDHIRIICGLLENCDRLTVFNFMISLFDQIPNFENSIQPILSLFLKITKSSEDVNQLIDKVDLIVSKLNHKQFPYLCQFLNNLLKQFPFIEKRISHYIRYIMKHLFSTEDIDSLLQLLVTLKRYSSPSLCDILNIKCDFFNYSSDENHKLYFTGLINDTSLDLSYLSSMLQQLFFLKSFKHLVFSSKINQAWGDSLKLLFGIMQFSQLPFYSLSGLYKEMELGNMSNPSRFFDLLMNTLSPKFSHLFTGSFNNVLQGLSNQSYKTTKVQFNKICLNVKDKISVEDSLESFFYEERIPSQDVIRYYTVEESPTILVLLLKIFVSTGPNMLSKIGTDLRFPDTIKLPHQSNRALSTIYELSGAVYHKGKINGGKYVSQINVQGQSYLFDYQNISKFQRGDDMSPFLLFYVKQGSSKNDDEEHLSHRTKKEIDHLNRRHLIYQILFSEKFRTFISNFNNALLLTKYSFNVFCHSKFDPNLLISCFEKKLTKYDKALIFLTENIEILNKIPNPRMKLTLVHVVNLIVHNSSENLISVFFEVCFNTIDSGCLSKLIELYFESHVVSEITRNWGQKISNLILKSKSGFSALFPILIKLNYNKYSEFIEIMNFIFDDLNSSISFIHYLQFSKADTQVIIKNINQKSIKNVILASVISKFPEIIENLLNTRAVSHRAFWKILLNGLHKDIPKLRESLITQFILVLNSLITQDYLIVEQTVYNLFPTVVSPVILQKKSIDYNRNDSSSYEENEEEEEEEEKFEYAKSDKVDNDDKPVMKKFFNILVNFAKSHFDENAIILSLLRLIVWMINVGDFTNDKLPDICLNLIQNKNNMSDQEKCQIFELVKFFPITFFTEYFPNLVKFTFPAQPSVFAYFFKATSKFFRIDSGSLVFLIQNSPLFLESFKKFLNKASIQDINIFVESALNIEYIHLSKLIQEKYLNRLTIQTILCYIAFTPQLEDDLIFNFVGAYFYKCQNFKPRYSPLFGNLTHAISTLMCESLPNELFKENIRILFELFEKDESSPFRKYLRNLIVMISQRDSTLCQLILKFVINSKKKSKSILLDLHTIFLYTCKDPSQLNQRISDFADMIPNCNQKDIFPVLDSIEFLIVEKTAGIHSKRISEIVDHLIEFDEWSKETEEFVSKAILFINETDVLNLVDIIIDAFDCSGEVPEDVFINAIKKGSVFIKSRPNLKEEILGMFEVSDTIDNWPPELQLYAPYYTY
ncbi:hypothetical protein TRFO_33509 [Tritrichomonas foetus]|uniref:USP domain-containing protein n=1 Tax=Tritrichomonas foetus TaxID=1144522 RepID=A0A1J4JMM0_9EUKA|nr:hypothetical protein TRFO_33509 [Tritrichomonas foetus]|eukprot:OHS99945.1 hypothetical protein TRFO_33509 [Tritrichomonas foetus]